MRLDPKKAVHKASCIISLAWLCLAAAQTIEFPVQGSASPKYWLDAGFFKQNSQQTRIELYYSIAIKELQFRDVSGEKLASFVMSISVSDKQGRTVFSDKRRKGARGGKEPASTDETVGLVDQFSFSLAPGEYRLEAKLNDENAGTSNTINGHMLVPAFSGYFAVSEPQLSLTVQSDLSNPTFVKGNVSVVPNASRRYRYHDASMPFFYEMYFDSSRTTANSGVVYAYYSVTDQAGDTLLYIPKQKAIRTGAYAARVAGLDVRGLEKGEHRLQIMLTDSASGQTAFSQKRFWIHAPVTAQITLPTTPADLKRYRDQIKYLASRDELRIFDALDAAGKANFVLNFWRMRDTTPETPENEYMQNVFARIDYCMKNFKGKENGLNCDMGRVFVFYGQPDDIETHTWETGSKPYIIWRYFTSHAQHEFVFVDRNHEGIFSLVHSTVEEEIKNENWQAQELQ
jgi:GWxTD domain-containing protein